MAARIWTAVTVKGRSNAHLRRRGTSAALRPVPMKHMWSSWLECVGDISKWRPGQLARWERHVLRR